MADPLPGAPRVRIVGSFEELITTRFAGEVNALCWPRTLPGDFAEVLTHLPRGPGISGIEDEELDALPLTPSGQLAAAAIREDLRRLRERDLDPVVEVVNGYLRDAEAGPVRTDVCSFHVDRAPVEADTWLCTYHGASSEGLRNEDALRRIDLRETRAALLALYRGADDAGFAEYLSDHCYDLHYLPRPGTAPYVFGVGNLWRIACDWPGSPVLPCIHRAPETALGDSPRLLLIS